MYTKDPTSYAYAYMQLEMEDRSIFTLKLIVMEHFCRCLCRIMILVAILFIEARVQFHVALESRWEFCGLISTLIRCAIGMVHDDPVVG